ncbi:PTS sugar transporter subunit IIA [Secundilactobacillus silagei]|uniref:Ascorbate-specific PTS system EIIA component n=1 Tax=Secundilactobacillus silagei JCM 19001 TaxID=1302250 RepID=A0A1Z5IG53_9LACO|nr:PTS sugar transporter subunit IIA [Secundilactobacillus silagei]TDG73342.1 hypothetical protein C5L25_000491 [Secundilactobacillus silagei JCM 19001]GAX00713.1 ascorbate-specific PTS system IIA component [Secundilactobacillus silagei JCM 19001]
MIDLLNAKTLQVTDGSNLNWETAITKAAQPLVDQNTIESTYVDSIINVVKDKGPYMNIGPQIALAHARPDDSVHEIGLSLLKTNSSVNLVDDKHPVKLWFVLAATDSQSHLSVIQQLMGLLTDDDAVQALLEADSVDQILAVLQKH